LTEALFYTTEEVATLLRVSERTANNLAARSEIPGAVKVGREWRFDRAKLEEHLGRKLPEPREGNQ
jgi:excisionase family DNA binding protein